MSQPILYTITNDTVTVFIKGEPTSVSKGAANYLALRAAVLNEDWDSVPKHLTIAQTVESWAESVSAPTPAPAPAPPPIPAAALLVTTQAQFAAARNVANAPVAGAARETARFSTPAPAAPVPQGGTIKVEGEVVLFNGEPVPTELNTRILKAVAKGEGAEGLMNFWRRLKRNPNQRSVDQLWGFLAHCGIPVQPDGTFLAYKGVRRDFRDAHSGTFDNSPGKTVKMDRSKISTDPAQTCHTGLHVGALGYASSFAALTLIVRVDPEHVCCVPNDHNAQKMRVCEYTVMGLYGAQMPDSQFEADAPVTVAPASQVGYTKEELAASHKATEGTDRVVSYEPEGDYGVEDEDDTDDIEGSDYEDNDYTLGDTEDAPIVEEQQLPITGSPWDEYNLLTVEELLKQPIADLRKYARYNCLIIGASKLLGGREALVAKINDVRTLGVMPQPVVEAEPEPVVEPVVEETQPMAPGEEAAVKLPLTGTEWDHLNEMDSLTLMGVEIADLRKYATYNCLIVGASKIPGGKLTLVARICDVRGDGQ